MVGYVCVVAGGKGGVGKTTTAINAGAALATAGHDVVLVDADLGMANLGAMLGIEPPASVHDVLAGEAKPEEALVTSDIGLAVLAGERRLEAYADADPAALGKLLEALRAEYDFVLVDTGAGLSHDLLVPIGVADGVLLVTTPDDVAIADAVKTLDLAGRVDADIIGAVLTRITAAVDVDAIADDLLVPLLGAIPEHGTDATAVVRTDPDGPAGSAYQDLADRLERIALEGANPASLAVTAESVELAAAAAGHGGEAVVDG
ncbi:MAG: MinD/ParA family protein, partial [Salinirussus sp.]